MAHLINNRIPWLRILRLIHLIEKKTAMSFPTSAFAIVMDFAKGGRTWSVEVFEAVLDMAKWCYRLVGGAPQGVELEAVGGDPVAALELLRTQAEGDSPAQFTPAVAAFVLQWLVGIILEKLKDKLGV